MINLESDLRELYWNNAEIIDVITILIETIRIQNGRIQRRKIIDLTQKMQKMLSRLSLCFEVLQQNGLSWTMLDLQDTLEKIEETQNVQDDILMADYYEILLLPALEELQCVIIGMNIHLKKEEWFENNLNVLKEHDRELYHALVNFTGENFRKNCEYLVEPSSGGYYTLALQEKGKKKYLHSNRNPLSEARAFARREYRVEQDNYILVGMGMGYIMHEMLALYPEMKLVVIEPDLTIIYMALQYADWTAELERIELCWDPDWARTRELLMEDLRLVIFRPEISHIEEMAIQQQLITIAARQDGIDDQVWEFYHNTKENIRFCDHYIDELAEQIMGKDVVIVAGGPSLDRNVTLLKNRPNDVKVIAVGTVYKLLLKLGIKIDYVIVSDCQIFSQIEGIENEQVPLLILATADRRISRCYRGPKYLVCQEGYAMAAEYARSKGHQCYTGGGSVSTLALDVAIRLKAASIAFIGLDLAFDGERSHATGTGKEVYGGYEYQRARGVHGDMVNTCLTFVSYRKWMEQRICEQDACMPVIDATEGGAMKKGFQIMKLKEYLEICGSKGDR